MNLVAKLIRIPEFRVWIYCTDGPRGRGQNRRPGWLSRLNRSGGVDQHQLYRPTAWQTYLFLHTGKRIPVLTTTTIGTAVPRAFRPMT